jgi:hypothetical protein
MSSSSAAVSVNAASSASNTGGTSGGVCLLSASGIVKVWLRFSSDSEDSYTSLPCAPECMGRELAEKVALSVKKRRGFNIQISPYSASTTLNLSCLCTL